MIRVSDFGDGVITDEATRGAAVGDELQNWTKRESGSASGRFQFSRMRTVDPKLPNQFELQAPKYPIRIILYNLGIWYAVSDGFNNQ